MRSFQDMGESLDDRLWYLRRRVRRLAVKLHLVKAPPALPPMSDAMRAELQQCIEALSKPNPILDDLPWVYSYKGIPIRMPMATWRMMNSSEQIEPRS